MRGEQGEEKEMREEWRVKREEQLTMTERDGEDSTKNKVETFQILAHSCTKSGMENVV